MFSLLKQPTISRLASILLAFLVGIGVIAVSAPTASAARKGVAACVKNESKARIKVDWITSDTRTRDGWIPPGQRACAEGTFSTKADLAVRVTWADGLSMRLDLNNPVIGVPTVTVDPGKQSAAAACSSSLGNDDGLGFTSDCADGFKVGTTNEYSTRYGTIRVTRKDDDAWKQFAIRVIE